jgi:hypothetical protein
VPPQKPKRLLAEEVAESVREEIGYHPAKFRCANCLKFVPTDMSGNSWALDSHCTLMSPLLIRVQSDGFCDHFSEK